MTELTARQDVSASPDLRTRTVQWQDPLIGAGLASGLAGIDYLRAIISGDVPSPPIAALLGFGIGEVEVGSAMFTLDVGEHLYNPIGSVHGGVFATLLDSVMGCAVHTMLEAGQGYTTLDLNVHMVRGLTVDVPSVRAVGTVVTAGRRVATATGQIVDDAGIVYAHGSTTCLVFSHS